MDGYVATSIRVWRALGAVCVLLFGLVPLGLFLMMAIAAGLSDNPDNTGPGTGAFLLAFGIALACTGLAGRVALEPALRADLGRWGFWAAVVGLLPVYPSVAVLSDTALRGNGRASVAVAFILGCGVGYVYLWAAVARSIGRRRGVKRRLAAGP